MNSKTAEEEKKQRRQQAIRNLIIGLAIIAVAVFVMLKFHPGGYGLMNVNLEISCQALSEHPDRVTDASLRQSLPADGVILEKTSFQLETGKTALDLLQAAAKEKGLTVEVQTSGSGQSANMEQAAGSDKAPGSGQSVWIQSIQGLGGDQPGGSEGWAYTLNGEVPSYGPELCHLQEGDNIVFYYYYAE